MAPPLFKEAAERTVVVAEHHLNFDVEGLSNLRTGFPMRHHWEKRYFGTRGIKLAEHIARPWIPRAEPNMRYSVIQYQYPWPSRARTAGEHPASRGSLREPFGMATEKHSMIALLQRKCGIRACRAAKFVMHDNNIRVVDDAKPGLVQPNAVIGFFVVGGSVTFVETAKTLEYLAGCEQEGA
jgi:hypothetical protein